MNIFQKASMDGLRFNTNSGFLNVEDLWQMRLKELDDMAVFFKNKLSNSETESFLSKRKVKDETLQLKFDIAKAVIDCRVEMLDKQEKSEARRVKNNKIMELIVEKENDEMKQTDIETLRSMLEEED